MRRIDLGCGTSKEPGSIGVDRVNLPGVDVVANLFQFPYPFADDSFDEIFLNDVIEHLPDTIQAMEELYRICQPDGHIHIRVINWNSSFNADDPTHIRTFSEKTFNFFGTDKTRLYYSKARFSVMNIKRGFNTKVQRWVRSKRLLLFLSHYLNNILETLWFDLKANKNKDKKSDGTDDNLYISFLRCPYCLLHNTSNQYSSLQEKNSWLVCMNLDCRRKYPVFDGVAFITLEEGEKWKETEPEQLPSKPPIGYQVIIS